MKKFATLFIAVFLSVIAFGQEAYQDVVYLSNGSVIRGVIVEQVPSVSIKIETADCSVFAYSLDEVQKITKEPPVGTKKRSRDAKKKEGYIGAALGLSLPLGDYGDLAEPGLQITLVDFGYHFTPNFGLAASWFGAAHPYDGLYLGVDPWSIGAIVVGPLISVPFSETVELDIRPMIGYASVNVPGVPGLSLSSSGSSFASNLEADIRVHVSNRLSLASGASYFSASAFSFPFRTMNIKFGAAYRLNRG